MRGDEDTMGKVVVWSEQEKETLKRLYPSADWKLLLKSLPERNQSSITNEACRLGIKRKRRESITLQEKMQISATKHPDNPNPRSVCIILHRHGQDLKGDPNRLNSKFMLKLVKSVGKSKRKRKGNGHGS